MCANDAKRKTGGDLQRRRERGIETELEMKKKRINKWGHHIRVSNYCSFHLDCFEALKTESVPPTRADKGSFLHLKKKLLLQANREGQIFVWDAAVALYLQTKCSSNKHKQFMEECQNFFLMVDRCRKIDRGNNSPQSKTKRFGILSGHQPCLLHVNRWDMAST